MKMLFGAVALLAISSGLGQEQPRPKTALTDARHPAPAFDVAAIHQNKADQSGRSHIWSAPTDGYFKTGNVTAMALVQWAYNMPDSRITGGPSWIRSARFDIEAKADSETDEKLRLLDSAQARQIKRRMVQSLLLDRFGLKAHEEKRNLPVYALVVAKGGPKFQPSKINGTTISGGENQISVAGSDHTLALLTEQLAKVVGRVVVDKTGIDGRFDLTLKWAPDNSATGTGGADADSGSGPSIFTAIQEQLGLKLKPEKGPVQIVVIDRLEMPSQN